MAVIYTSKAYEVLVDDEDYFLVSVLGPWSAKSGGRGLKYAQANNGVKPIYMHRLIMGAKPGQIVDHKNGNGLDNRTANLRFATNSQNSANRRQRLQQSGKSSRYKGVSWDKEAQRWCAQICVEGRSIHLGLYLRASNAAIAYDIAARKHFGEFACTNDSLGLFDAEG